MTTNKLKKLTNVLVVSAGILTVGIQPLFAQAAKQSGTQESPVKKGGQRSEKAMSSQAGSGFVNKAAESNLAEIELSQVALQNASSQQVKDYAQQMVDHHSMAQQELASIVSGNTAMHANNSGKMSDKKSNSADDANADDRNNTEKMNSAGSNASGATTGTGSTYSSGNASGATGTQGSTAGAGNTSNTNTSGTNSSSTGGTTDGTKAGVGTGSDYKSSSTGGGGAGANSGGTTSSTNAGTGVDPRKSENTSTATNNTAASNTGDDSKERRTVGTDANDNSTGPDHVGKTNNMENTNNDISMSGGLPVELSAEHKALQNKLSNLSGAEFDRQYMQAMVKDHAKAVALFEKQSKNSEDAALQAYAVKTLPVIKQHYQMAQKLNSMKSSGAKSSSN